MVDVGNIPKSYQEAVRTLAEWHAEEQDYQVEIYHFPDPNKEVVQLVEVSAVFPQTDNVAPARIGPSSEFPFRSAVALVSPSEWDLVKKGQLALPKGWDLNSMIRVWPDE